MFLKSNAAILQGILSFVMKIFLKRNAAAAATLQGVLCFVIASCETVKHITTPFFKDSTDVSSWQLHALRPC